jgi:hypothetical protein
MSDNHMQTIHANFMHVGNADNDCAGLSKALNNDSVRGGRAIAIDVGRAQRRHDALDV